MASGPVFMAMKHNIKPKFLSSFDTASGKHFTVLGQFDSAFGPFGMWPQAKYPQPNDQKFHNICLFDTAASPIITALGPVSTASGQYSQSQALVLLHLALDMALWSIL